MLIIRNFRTTLGFVTMVLCLVSLSALAQRVIDPAQFESAIMAFEMQDEISMPAAGGIVLTGSSSIARWNQQAEQALAPLSVIPRGFGGSVMEHVLYNLDRVALKYKPRAILIYEGDNDTAFEIPQEKVIDQFNEIVARVHRELPETRVYVLSVKPSMARVTVWPQAKQLSAGLKLIAQSNPLVHYIDVATPLLKADGTVMDDIFIEDGLHLNRKGNQIWGATIKAGLIKTEGQYQ
jgi:lysophospholipase L1-like esterase